MTLKSSVVSMFALLIILSGATVATHAYADNDGASSEQSESADDNDGGSNSGSGAISHDDSEHSDAAEADDDDAGPVTMGGKTSGKGCFVKRSDGVKVPC
jgi:hypothetical protein